jgi:nitronate monooxygenase
MVIRALDVPVVGAPMAGGPSTPELAAAVSDAGGLGFLAAGYLTAAQLSEQVADVWSRTSRPFGVNLFVPQSANTYAAGPGGLGGPERARAVAAYRASLTDEARRFGIELPEPQPDDTDDWDRKLDVVVREGIPVVSFTFGLPSPGVIAQLQRAGTETVATVSDVAEAEAALEAGVDSLCVQGHDAGGHRGTLDPVKEPADLDVVDLVARIRPLTDRPIVAAGGLGTPDRAAQAKAAGADAVQVGTALLLTPEAGTSLAYRRALTDARFAETVVTRAFSGRWARALDTGFIRAHGPDAPAAYPEVHHVTSALRRAAARADDPELLALWAGTGWRAAQAVPAAVVVAELAAALT